MGTTCPWRWLNDSGVFLACHWRAPMNGSEMSGIELYRILDARLDMHRVSRHTEVDFIMDVWSMDARSVAQREMAG